MWRYIFWKFWTSLIALVVISLLFFFLYVGIKGNPFTGSQATMPPKDYQIKLDVNGINDALIVRFWHWLTGIMHGNWGQVYDKTLGNKTIPHLLFAPLKNSMMVMIPSFFIGMFLGLFLGFVAGYNRGKVLDVFINGFVTIFIAIPSFILAAFALIIGPLMGLPIVFQNKFGTSILIRSLIMPIIVMTLVSLASWTYLTRIEVSSILSSDYIVAARTRGFSWGTIFWKYVFKNAMYPFAGSLATTFMVVFGSSLVVEKFFNVDGTATLLLAASKKSEVNILMFNLVFFLFIGLFAQAISDVAQFTINPIVRSSFSTKSSPLGRIKYAYIRNKNAKSKDRGVS